MGQQLFKVNFEKIITPNEVNDTTQSANYDTIRSCIEDDKINCIFPRKIDDSLLNAENPLIKQIRNDIFTLTNCKDSKEIDTEINEILINEVFSFVKDNYQKAMKDATDNWEKQKQLRISLSNKLKEEEEEEEDDDESVDNNPKLSYIALQSLTSILLILIKSVEKSDSTIVQQILSLTSELSEQLPMGCLSSSNNSIYLFKSLKPIEHYIEDLSYSSDLKISKQAMKILFNFSIARTSFKDILPLLNRLIFDQNNHYNLRKLINKLNKNLQKMISENSDLTFLFSYEYLISIQVFPTEKLRESNEKELSGQMISSILLSHIHLNNSNQFSYEFHPKTFEQLFLIIERLFNMKIPNSNVTLHLIFRICLNLFTKHFESLFDLTTKLYQNILSTDKIESIEFVSNEELTKWFDLFLQLSIDDQNENLSDEASKAFILILEKKSETFTSQLSFIHQLILENEHQILIKYLLLQLNKPIILLNWIEILSNENSERLKCLNILFSLMKISFNRNDKQIEQILLSFQQLLFYRLIEQSPNTQFFLSNLIIEYLTCLFQFCSSNENELFRQMLSGLYLMIQKDDLPPFQILEPIFTGVLPLLSEYSLKSNCYLIDYLLGKMSEIMIIGSPLDSLEKKYIDQLNSPILSGGWEIDDIQSSPDQQLLMSIYENTGQGQKFLSKLRMSLKINQQFLQKSIEEQVHNASASIFAVYIKHYRRINLLRSDLLRETIHPELLSLYRYSNSIENVFINLKGQGEDCQQFYLELKAKCLFLLLSIKENDFIPIIEEDLIEEKQVQIHFHRQVSRWTKARCVIRLLRNLFNACLRFKKLILHKKPKINSEQIFHQSIEQFLSQENHFNQQDFEQIVQQENQRAKTRLFIYHFIQSFIQQLNDSNRFLIYLNQLNHLTFDWSYLQNIQLVNDQLKVKIRQVFYQIIQNIFSFEKKLNKFQLEILMKNLFNFVNICYQSKDISYLYQYQIMDFIFQTFLQHPQENFSLNLKYLSFNWFRLLTFHICQNQFKEEKLFLFNQFILQQLKQLKSIQINSINDQNQIISLQNLANGWFHYSINKNEEFSSSFEVELYLNQYLVLLFQCIQSYEHIRLICANIDYIKQILEIYYQSKSTSTILLSLKILGQLISSLTNYFQEKFIEKFLMDCLISIGQSFSSENNLINQLVETYRIIISRKCSYQIFGTQLIFKSFDFYENSDDINQLTASLCILGGYIQPFTLGSIVQILNQNEKIQFGIIIENNGSSCLIQYFDTNQTELINIDQLEIENCISPPSLLLIPNGKEFIDKLIHLIQLEKTNFLFLQIKRRAISSLFYLLNNPKLIEIFIEKSYLSILGQLAFSQSIDLAFLTRQNLEQFYLIEKKSFVNIDMEKSLNQTIPNQNLIDYLSTSIWKYNGWKPYATKNEIEYFSQGRLGNNQISIILFPKTNTKKDFLEECGNKHRFKGKVCATSKNVDVRFPSFILDNFRVSEGNWYFSIKLPVGGIVQIGWATDGFSPGGSKGIGDDLFSWSYDGSRDILFHNRAYSTTFNNIRWKSNDVCGCGIEINQQNISIKYWLNGKLLGTAFSHEQNLSSSSTKCHFLPNGPTTSFFPGITFQSYSDPPTICEWILSPEDMIECPLPQGYKPLLMPKLIEIENCIVDYPNNAYLIGHNRNLYFSKNRINPSKRFLRDFVNQSDLETEFNLDEDYLLLTKDSLGFPLLIENDISSFTITLDIQFLIDQSIQLHLLTFDISEQNSIQIPLNNIDQKIQQIVFIVHLKEQQILIYTKNQSQILNIHFPNQWNSKIPIYLLPKVDVKIRNIAIWKSSLSPSHIDRLFTYGLSYISTDFEQLKEHQQRMNTFTFEEQQFRNELLIPFDQTFKEDIWEKKKNQSDLNESNYFKLSTIQFYGNKTYLILDKSKDSWIEYTIILDILIPNYPINKEQLTIITLNFKVQLFVNDQGQISLKENSINHISQSSLIPNQYIRLFIILQRKFLKIYLNQSLEIDLPVLDDRFAAKLNRLELFREIDSTKNSTNEQTLRIECQSITFLNQSIDIEDLDQNLKYPGSSLQSLVKPSLSLISTSLIAIGYKQSWIESVIKQYQITNIQMIDQILRQQHQQFIQIDFQKQREIFLKNLKKFHFSIDQQQLETRFDDPNFDLNKQIEFVLNHSQTDHHFDINVKEWLIDNIKTKTTLEDITPNSNNNQTRRPTSWFDDDDDEDDDEDGNQTNQHLTILRNLFFKEGEQQDSTQEDFHYKLTDLTQSEEDQNEEFIQICKKSNLNCCRDYEYALIRIYARSIIDNIINIWSNNSTQLFPLEKFGNWTFIVSLFVIMNEHSIYTKSQTDQIDLLIKSILKSELKTLSILLFNENCFSYHLKKHILYQLIELIIDPSLFNDQQSNWNFLLKILNIFVELITTIDKQIFNEDQINKIIEYFFPQTLINLLFNAFLVITTYQSKIYILHIFSRLIETSEYFHLKSEIQNILFELLIELSTNFTKRTNKHFQMALMDLIYLLLMKKRKETISFKRSDLPKSLENLFSVIEIIHLLNDQSKKKEISERFFNQFEEILTNEEKLNRDDFEKCIDYFNPLIDQELIDFIDLNSSSEDSFSTFIENLPNEFSSIPEKCSSLAKIPIDSIQNRMKFFYELNRLIGKVLPMIDFNYSSGQSFLTDQIRLGKKYLFHQSKLELLNMSLDKTSIVNIGPTIRVSFDIVKSNENKANRMFHQAYRQLFHNAQIDFRKKVRQMWQSVYVGMHSTDQGGPYRDSITQICSDICSTRLSLFILCPNGRTNIGLNRDCWIPNVFPMNEQIPIEFQNEYRFIGQLMGLAIRKKHYLDLKFPLLFWKELLNQSITIEDIQQIDLQSFTILNEIEKNFEQTISTDNNNNNNDINEIFSSIISELHFEVVSSSGETYQLIPGGMNISITTDNFKQYSNSYRQYRLKEFQRQIQFIRQGLSSVVPFYFLTLFTPVELEEAICGKGHIDIELLKRNTQYSECGDEETPHIQRFWTCLTQMFNEEQKKLFLTFVWGRNTLPTRDQDFTTKFTINQFYAEDDYIDKTLPRSHTCVFSIDLPEYSTIEIMYERLNYAITYCSSIDGDGNFNEDPNTLIDTDSDDFN